MGNIIAGLVAGVIWAFGSCLLVLLIAILVTLVYRAVLGFYSDCNAIVSETNPQDYVVLALLNAGLNSTTEHKLQKLRHKTGTCANHDTNLEPTNNSTFSYLLELVHKIRGLIGPRVSVAVTLVVAHKLDGFAVRTVLCRCVQLQKTMKRAGWVQRPSAQ
jgi:disulfide bond formation protein DsbB